VKSRWHCVAVAYFFLTPGLGAAELTARIVDARGALVPEPVRERRVVGHAQGAVHLDGPVHHLLQDAGDEVLHRRDLLPRAALAFEDSPQIRRREQRLKARTERPGSRRLAL